MKKEMDGGLSRPEVPFLSPELQLFINSFPEPFLLFRKEEDGNTVRMVFANQMLQLKWKLFSQTEEFCPSRYPELIKAIRKSIQTGAACEIQSQISGTWIYVSVSSFMFGNGMYGCFLRDISREKETEKILRREQKRMEVVLRQSVEMIFDWDMDADCVLIPKNYVKRWKLPEKVENPLESLVQQGMMAEESIKTAAFLQSSMLEGKRRVGGRLLLRRNRCEEFRWYEVTLMGIGGESGAENWAVGSLRNIHAEVIRERELENRASRDSLTGLYNKQTMERQIDLFLRSSAEKGRAHTLFFMDIDDFKQINDTWGHPEGDQCLLHLSRLLSSIFRKNDWIGRVGGDEFMVFAQNTDSIKFIRRVSQAIFQGLEREAEGNRNFSVSLGVALYPDCPTFQQLYYRADQAVYCSKAAGKKCLTVYEHGEYTVVSPYDFSNWEIQ